MFLYWVCVWDNRRSASEEMQSRLIKMYQKFIIFFSLKLNGIEKLFRSIQWSDRQVDEIRAAWIDVIKLYSCDYVSCTTDEVIENLTVLTGVRYQHQYLSYDSRTETWRQGLYLWCSYGLMKYFWWIKTFLCFCFENYLWWEPFNGYFFEKFDRLVTFCRGNGTTCY